MADHYYTKKPTSELRAKNISCNLLGNELEFTTGSGTFSIDRVDKGTELLIKKCYLNEDDVILDLGCGWGALGIALKKALPKLKVTMSDVNKRATMLAKKNCELNNVKCRVVDGDCYESVKSEKFDVILLNPPQTAGKALCIKMLTEAKDYLKPKGSIQIVVRHKKGGKSLSEEMELIFGNMAVLAKGSGYRIYSSEFTGQ
jgi:16S rRNA (guanine1207-N2)-methyltransferase